jgi:Spy/CpxP family protein refolding chaperone
MLSNKVCFALVALLLFLPSILFGQEMMDGKWWQNKRIAEKLEITNSEKQSLDDKYVAGRRKLITLKGEVEMERFELDTLLDREDSKRDTITAQFNKLETARSKLSAERFNMLLEVRDIIGIERFQQLKSAHRDRRKKMVERIKKERGSSKY